MSRCMSPETLSGGEIIDSSSDLMSMGGGIWVRRADMELIGVGKVIPDDCNGVLFGSDPSGLLRYVVSGRGGLGVSCIVVAGVGDED